MLQLTGCNSTLIAARNDLSGEGEHAMRPSVSALRPSIRYINRPGWSLQFHFQVSRGSAAHLVSVAQATRLSLLHRHFANFVDGGSSIQPKTFFRLGEKGPLQAQSATFLAHEPPAC
jgi:hypothetical protein